MRIVFTLLVVIAILVAIAIAIRSRDRAASNVLILFAGVFGLMLLGAFFGLV